MIEHLSDIEKHVASTNASSGGRHEEVEVLRLKEEGEKNPEEGKGGEKKLTKAEEIRRVELAAKESEVAVAGVAGQGKGQYDRFLGKAGNLGIPPEVTEEVLGSEAENIRRLSEGRKTAEGNWKKKMAKMMAFVLGVGGAGVPGSAKALEMGVDAGSTVIAAKRVAEGVPENPILKEAETKMTLPHSEALRVAANESEPSSAEILTEKLKKESETLKRLMGENEGGDEVETPEEKEDRQDQQRDDWEDKKAEENEAWMQEQIDEKIDREEDLHQEELRKAIQMEGQPLREKLEKVYQLKTPEQITEFLGELAKESSLEANVYCAVKRDGTMVVLAANPGQERESVYSEINAQEFFDFLRENPDAQIFDYHNHPKKVIESATDGCSFCADPEKSINAPSPGDFEHALGGLDNDVQYSEAPEDLREFISKKSSVHRVVTQHGVWEFSSEGEEVVSLQKEVKRSEYENEAISLEAGRDESIQQFIKKWGGEGWKLKFTPFDENGKLDSNRTIQTKDIPGWGDR